MKNPIYLISGETDIAPAVGVLRRRGCRILHDNDVDDDAWATIKPYKSFVVIAHGLRNGTVRWRKSSNTTSINWMWVGMRRPRASVRIYLYCCHVGVKLPRYLKNCEAFGHLAEVPIPSDAGDTAILGFLDEVHKLVRRKTFDAEKWRSELVEYLKEKFVAEVETPTSLSAPIHLYLLLKSLGHGVE